MNHSEAIESRALAAYLLGDLSGAERNAFELHTIDCPICAEAVWTGTKAAAEAPSMSQPLPKPLVFRLRQRAGQWLSVAAAATLAFVLGGQVLRPAMTMPMLEVADPADFAMTGVMRGPEAEQSVVFQDDRRVEIIINTAARRRFPAYRLELRDAADKVLHKIDLTPKQALHEDGVPVLLRPLPAGRYVLAILGVPTEGNPEELDQTRVVVQ